MSALQWLAAAALMTALLWVPYVLERMVALGVIGAMKPVDPEDELKQALWARRAKRAHYNAVENLAVFATLVLVAFTMGKGAEPGILIATQVYFWARPFTSLRPPSAYRGFVPWPSSPVSVRRLPSLYGFFPRQTPTQMGSMRRHTFLAMSMAALGSFECSNEPVATARR